VVGAVTGSDHLRSSSSGAGPQYFPAAGVRTCSGWQSDRAYASTWTTLSTNPLGADHGVECDQANTEKSVRIRVAAVSRRDRAAARGSAGGVELRLCHLLGLDELGRGSGGGELRVRIACSVA
jgi:hypothetical protein